jgi:hypothetical protein
MVSSMTAIVAPDVGTGRKIFFPFLVMDLPDPSSADDVVIAGRQRASEPEPVLADTSPGTTTIWAPNRLQRDLDTLVIHDATGFLDTVQLRKHGIRLLAEPIITYTMIAPKAFKISGTTLEEAEEPLEEATATTGSVANEISAPHAEVTELLSLFLENVQTEEIQDRCELIISGIIDSYGTSGIDALQAHLVVQAQLVAPTLEPLFWKFLTALGVRRGDPTDRIAKEILLRHLNSPSAGRRAASASALGAIPDAAVLTALERRAAVEQNRMVQATLNAHIRTLKRHGLPAPKIL